MKTINTSKRSSPTRMNRIVGTSDSNVVVDGAGLAGPDARTPRLPSSRRVVGR